MARDILLDRRMVVLGGLAGAAALRPGIGRAADPRQGRRAINVAGRQRMLTQRMSRAAVFVGLDVDVERHLSILDGARREFERAHHGFYRGDADLGLADDVLGEAVPSWAIIDAMWRPFDEAARAIVDRGAAREEEVVRIAESNVMLLQASDALVKRLVELWGAAAGDSSVSITIDIAGRQRMLSQKMIKECGLIAYGWRPAETTASVMQTVSLFDASHRALTQQSAGVALSPPPAPAARKLAEVGTLWEDLGPVVQSVALGGRCNAAQLRHMAGIADPLLVTMNEAVGLYEAT